VIVDKKPLVYIWQPFYRLTFGGIVWPFLARVKAFFFAESQVQLQEIIAQLSAVKSQLRTFESNQRAQWTAFERLYLCFLSDPDRNARSQAEQLLEAGRHNQSLQADLANRLIAFDQRTQLLLEQLPATEDRNRTLQDHVTALNQACRMLTSRFADLETENRRRWDSLEQFLSTFLSAPDERPGGAPHN
jgi:chromosome segregation ATPase